MKKDRFVYPVLILLTISFILIINLSCTNRNNDPENRSKLVDYNTKATSLLKKKPDSAFIYADSAKINYEKARSRAIYISDTLLQATIDLKLGELMLNKGNLYTSEKYLWEAVEIFDKGQNNLKKGEAYNLYGSLVCDRGDIVKSQQYLFKAYACFDNTDHFSAISRICNNIATNFKAQGSKKEALAYYQKALECAVKAADTLNIASTLINLGVFYRRSFPDSSFIYYNKTLALALPGKNSMMQIIAQYNIANLYFDQNEFDKAKVEYFKLLEICRSEKNVGGIARIYTGLSAIHSKQGNYPLAEKYLTDAIALSDSVGDKKINLYTLNELKLLYTKTKSYKKALDLSLIIKDKGDSMLELEKQSALHDIEMLYQTEKKDAENVQLKLLLSNQQTKLRYGMTIVVLYILFTLGISFLFWRLIKLYRQRSIAYLQLVNKYKHESEQLSQLRNVKHADLQTVNEMETIQGNQQLLSQLIELYLVEKPYLDPKLKVETIAEKLNCSQKAIAAALKAYKENTFPSFTNRFRVDAAIAMMEDPAYNHYKIEAIAKNSGFGSKSNFYDTFESFTGVKPTHYRSYKDSLTSIVSYSE
ncbi:MAG: tetratricopeptide repeat protein [Mariniphaga sp.]